MFVLKQQRSLQNNTFLFLIPNRNIQASWKMKFLRTRKVSSSSLKFKFPCMNFFQLSHFKVDSKICRTPHENWGRRWHHCCDNFEWNWYIDRSSILWSRTFIRGWLQRLTPMSKTKHLRQMLICRLDRAVNERIQMWWLAKFFWIFKFKYTTKTLHYDLFRLQPTQKVHLTLRPTLTKYQQRFILLYNFLKRFEHGVVKFWMRFFVKMTFFLDVGCCPNIVDETLILSGIVWKKDSDKFSSNVFSIYFNLTSYFSLLLLLLRMQNCTKDNAKTISKK